MEVWLIDNQMTDIYFYMKLWIFTNLNFDRKKSLMINQNIFGFSNDGNEPYNV